jgi:hypothetical protein
MTTSTCFLKWRHNEASYEQHFGPLKKKENIFRKKKVNEDEYKHRENVKKIKSIKK